MGAHGKYRLPLGQAHLCSHQGCYRVGRPLSALKVELVHKASAPHLGSSTQSSGLESLGSSISSGGLKEGLKSSNKEPLFLLSPSMSTSYLQTGPGAVVTVRQAN